MNCEHQFLVIETITKIKSGSMTPGINQRFNQYYGIMAGCALCGEIRKIWETGEIETMPPFIKPKSNDTGNSSNKTGATTSG